MTAAHESGQPDQAEPIDELLRQRLSVLSPLSIEIIDDSALHAGHAGARSGGGHYRLHIVSPCFSGKSTLARHRMIHDALGDLMQCRIHALSIQSRAPEEAS